MIVQYSSWKDGTIRLTASQKQKNTGPVTLAGKGFDQGILCCDQCWPLDQGCPHTGLFYFSASDGEVPLVATTHQLSLS